MRVLGLDPGSRLLGYGLLEGSGANWRRLDSGVFRFKARDPLPDRLALAFQSVQSLLRTWQPEHVAIEDCFVAQSPKAALVLGQVRGALLVAAKLEGKTVHEYAPRSVKSATVGNGGASKDQVQAMIPRLIGSCEGKLVPDEADALAVAWCCANQLRFERLVAPAGTPPA